MLIPCYKASIDGCCFAIFSTSANTLSSASTILIFAMPRQGINPLAMNPTANTCEACGKICKNKSGLTQHVKFCPVLLRRRLAVARLPRVTPHVDSEPEDDSEDSDSTDSDEDSADLGENGGGGHWDDRDVQMGIDNDRDADVGEEEDGVSREFHKGLTGVCQCHSEFKVEL